MLCPSRSQKLSKSKSLPTKGQDRNRKGFILICCLVTQFESPSYPHQPKLPELKVQQFNLLPVVSYRNLFGQIFTRFVSVASTRHPRRLIDTRPSRQLARTGSEAKQRGDYAENFGGSRPASFRQGCSPAATSFEHLTMLSFCHIFPAEV